MLCQKASKNYLGRHRNWKNQGGYLIAGRDTGDEPVKKMRYRFQLPSTKIWYDCYEYQAVVVVPMKTSVFGNIMDCFLDWEVEAEQGQNIVEYLMAPWKFLRIVYF